MPMERIRPTAKVCVHRTVSYTAAWSVLILVSFVIRSAWCLDECVTEFSDT